MNSQNDTQQTTTVPQFKVGDLVMLNSGGPTMTVTRILEGGYVNCTWMNDGKPEFHPFDTCALTPVTK